MNKRGDLPHWLVLLVLAVFAALLLLFIFHLFTNKSLGIIDFLKRIL